MPGEKGSLYASAILSLLFNATTITGIAENASSSPLANVYVSLHTADAGAGGNQTTNEVAYTGYSRVAVPRTTSGWTITGASAAPTANVTFPAATGGTYTATNFAIGTGSTGSGMILYSGTLSPSIYIVTGVTPIVAAAGTSVTES